MYTYNDWPLTEDEIESIQALESEAARAGDERQVNYCQRALAGDVTARKHCAEAIADAKAQADGG